MSMHWMVMDGADRGLRVAIAGCITENTDFGGLLALADRQSLVLDVSGIEQINSCGVREWIDFVTRATAAGVELELLSCSPAMVRQLNMISNFQGGSHIRSVLLPYYCAGCGHEAMREIDAGPEAPSPIEASVPCPGCGGRAEFDDFPETYLAFTR